MFRSLIALACLAGLTFAAPQAQGKNALGKHHGPKSPCTTKGGHKYTPKHHKHKPTPKPKHHKNKNKYHRKGSTVYEIVPVTKTVVTVSTVSGQETTITQTLTSSVTSVATVTTPVTEVGFLSAKLTTLNCTDCCMYSKQNNLQRTLNYTQTTPSSVVTTATPAARPIYVQIQGRELWSQILSPGEDQPTYNVRSVNSTDGDYKYSTVDRYAYNANNTGNTGYPEFFAIDFAATRGAAASGEVIDICLIGADGDSPYTPAAADPYNGTAYYTAPACSYKGVRTKNATSAFDFQAYYSDGNQGKSRRQYEAVYPYTANRQFYNSDYQLAAPISGDGPLLLLTQPYTDYDGPFPIFDYPLGYTNATVWL